MGNSLEQYRASVGLFNRCKLVQVAYGKSCLWMCVLLTYLFVITQLILLSGDVQLNPGPDKYPKLSICQSNVRGLGLNEMLDIKNSLASAFHVICVTETHLRDTSNINLTISDFHPIFRKDRIDKSWGGVAIFVSNHVVVKRRFDLERPNMEALWLECRIGNNKFLLCCCYRTPDLPIVFWDDLQLLLDLAKQSGIPNILLTGDLNADAKTNPTNHKYLCKFASSNNMFIHVDKPTQNLFCISLYLLCQLSPSKNQCLWSII